MLQARVRLAQYRELDARKRSGALRGLMWVHLREELEPDAIDWTDCLDRFSREDEGLPEKEEEPLTDYGVHREIQDALARLRTDLDSFSDAEAHALMCSAYLMTRLALAQHDGPLSNRTERPVGLALHEGGAAPQVARGFRAGVPRALRVGEQLPFKVWRLSPVLVTLSTIVLIVLGLAGIYVLADIAVSMGWLQAATRLTPIAAVLGTGAAIAALVAIRWATKKLRPRRRAGRAGHDWRPHCAAVRADVDPPDNLRSDIPRRGKYERL